MRATLTSLDWHERQAAYRAAISPWVNDWRSRSTRGVKHPVKDFLFEYYSLRPSHLLRWTPGYDVLLEAATPGDISWRQFQPGDGGLILPAQNFPREHRGYLVWATVLLTAIRDREPAHHCLGLHEWAMVYRSEAIRHASVPLRLAPEEIAEVVEAHGLRCTHYDAYRFFTPAAMPLNRVPLSRETTHENDQPGCIHANMDLYKFAYKLLPFIPSELLLATWELVWEARQLDMRASPYQLEEYGCTPIPIEHRDGREQYIREQQRIAGLAQPLRQQLIELYQDLVNRVV